MRVKEGEDIGASGSSDQTIKIWSLKDGRLLNTIYTHSVRERREGRGGGREGERQFLLCYFIQYIQFFCPACTFIMLNHQYSCLSCCKTALSYDNSTCTFTIDHIIIVSFVIVFL